MNNKANNRYWGLHTNNFNVEIKMLENNYIALGWKEMGDLNNITQNRESYYKHYSQIYPGSSSARTKNSAGQLFRFINDAKIGDCIVFPTKFDRKVNIGVIKSDYFFDVNEDEYPHKRKVEWIKTGIDRNYYSQGAKYEFGSYLSFFNIKNFVSEHESVLKGKSNYKNVDDDINDSISIDAIEDNTKDFILKQLSKNYKGYEFENVVSWLLNAIGYKTKNSNKGGDHGRDIIVYRDELPPRIIVQVKSHDGDVKEETVQSLKGALNSEDYGLFITLSDFTKNAKEFLAKQSQIKSINGNEFVDLLLKYYEYMPDEFKNVIKLKKVYMPILEDEKEE